MSQIIPHLNVYPLTSETECIVSVMSQIIPHLNILLQMILLQYIVSVMSQIIPHLNPDDFMKSKGGGFQ